MEDSKYIRHGSCGHRRHISQRLRARSGIRGIAQSRFSAICQAFAYETRTRPAHKTRTGTITVGSGQITCPKGADETIQADSQKARSHTKSMPPGYEVRLNMAGTVDFIFAYRLG